MSLASRIAAARRPSPEPVAPRRWSLAYNEPEPAARVTLSARYFRVHARGNPTPATEPGRVTFEHWDEEVA